MTRKNKNKNARRGGDAYQATLSTFVENLKAAAPESSILIAAPVDRAEKTDRGEIRTREIIVRLTDAQRKVAQSRGVAFWNTFEAMGGRGTVKRWLFTKPNLYNWDFTHPTTQGAMVIGDLLVGALLRGYSAYEARTPSAPSLPSQP